MAPARAKGTLVLARLPREKMTRADWTTHDYNVHFLLGIENDGAEPANVEACIECEDFDSVPDRKPMLYAATSIDGPWTPAPFEARTDGKTRYAFRARLDAGSQLHIANTLPRPLENTINSFRDIASRAGLIVTEYGRSLEGRPLLAAEAGSPDGTPVLVSSGFHPPEPDTLATLAILNWLASEEAAAARKEFRIVVIPVANPDGYARGTQGSNAADINMYWHFARELPDRCPEATALWQLAANLRPRGYIDFHCYTLQLDKKPGPYLRPIRYYRDPAIRTAVERLYSGFVQGPNLERVTTFPAFAPHTLGSMLSAEYQTVTLAKYHLHLKDGVEETERHGVQVLQRMLDALLESRIRGPAPKRTRPRPGLLAGEIWAGLLRPQLGLLRRGRLRELNFQRTGLVDPDAADLPQMDGEDQ